MHGRRRGQDPLLGRGDEPTLASLNNLAILYQAKVASTRRSRSTAKCSALGGHALGADHPMSIRSLNNLAFRLGTSRALRRGASAPAGGTSLAEPDARRRPSDLRTLFIALANSSSVPAISRRPASSSSRAPGLPAAAGAPEPRTAPLSARRSGGAAVGRRRGHRLARRGRARRRWAATPRLRGIRTCAGLTHPHLAALASDPAVPGPRGSRLATAARTPPAM